MPAASPKIQRALLSVTDKSGLANFATQLHKLGTELISTGGTAKLLREVGLPVQEVADLTGFPEMLDGRVKTIHPRVAAGVLARRGKPDHMRALAEHGIPTIDMVVVNLYDFAKVAANADAPTEELIEHIDIGGPTMIRAAAKNWQDVAVVVQPSMYAALAEELQSTCGALSRETHWKLMLAAFDLTASYDRAVSARLSGIGAETGVLPAALDLRLPMAMRMSYGENPHQPAALYSTRDAGLAGAKLIHGIPLSYNNLVDADAAWALVSEFGDDAPPACAIIKHTNPCGCAQATILVEAYQRALQADPQSAFGGVIAFNRVVDTETAEAVTKLKTDVVLAPAYMPGAVEVFQSKKNLRVLEITEPDPSGLVLRSISGGVLAQTADTKRFTRAEGRVVTHRHPTEEEWQALEFAWKLVKHVKSNAIVYARHHEGCGQLISAGSGQTSRVDSVKFGAAKAVLPLGGSVVASDAFFPFPDGLEAAVAAGATAAIQPGGSVKDADVIAAADRLGIAMVFTGARHFRH
jgi:phosphoribosylaminoimidazolecarboxamide formyltransferase/IMP cyclohydrolase